MEYFADTNIFIRYLVNDDAQKSRQVRKLLKKVEQEEIVLRVAEHVLCELVYVLSSNKLYNKTPSEVKNILLPIVSLANVKCDSKATFVAALNTYSEMNIDFEDCLTVAYARKYGIETIYSYDSHLDGFDGIKRLVP